MGCFHKEIILEAKRRGIHLVTDEILKQAPEIKKYETAMANFFIKHTSASLSINENADSTVRRDMEYYLNKTVPENDPNYSHTMEGSDDMPAHLKASILGSNVQIPIKNGQLNMGTWQGIYLCEHRNYGRVRKLVVTVWGVS